MRKRNLLVYVPLEVGCKHVLSFASLRTLDDAQVALGTVAEQAQCLLIDRTVMGRDGLRDAIKLDDDDALIYSALIDACGQPTCEESTTPCLKCRASESRIGGEGLLVTYRAVR